MQRAVDGDDVALPQHFLQVLNPTSSNLLFDFGLEWLVVKVEQFLAVERLESPKHTLSNAADGDGTNDLVLEIELVLCTCCHFPAARLNLLMRRDKVADQGQNGHDDMLRDRDDVAASYFSNGNASVALVGGVEIDMVGPNASCNGELELLGLG